MDPGDWVPLSVLEMITKVIVTIGTQYPTLQEVSKNRMNSITEVNHADTWGYAETQTDACTLNTL